MPLSVYGRKQVARRRHRGRSHVVHGERLTRDSADAWNSRCERETMSLSRPRALCRMIVVAAQTGAGKAGCLHVRRGRGGTRAGMDDADAAMAHSWHNAVAESCVSAGSLRSCSPDWRPG